MKKFFKAPLKWVECRGGSRLELGPLMAASVTLEEDHWRVWRTWAACTDRFATEEKARSFVETALGELLWTEPDQPSNHDTTLLSSAQQKAMDRALRSSVRPLPDGATVPLDVGAEIKRLTDEVGKLRREMDALLKSQDEANEWAK